MKSFFTNLKQRYNIRDYKISLVFLVTLISLVGILMVRSARPDLMNRQIMGVCLGLIVMFIISFIDYKWILNPILAALCSEYCYAPGCFGFWNKSKWREKMAEPWIYTIPAFRPYKNPYDSVLCKILNGTRAED